MPALCDVPEYGYLTNYPIGINIGCRHYFVSSTIWKATSPFPDFSVINDIWYMAFLLAWGIHIAQVLVVAIATVNDECGKDDHVCFHPSRRMEFVEDTGDFVCARTGECDFFFGDQLTSSRGIADVGAVDQPAVGPARVADEDGYVPAGGRVPVNAVKVLVIPDCLAQDSFVQGEILPVPGSQLQWHRGQRLIHRQHVRRSRFDPSGEQAIPGPGSDQQRYGNDVDEISRRAHLDSCLPGDTT